MAIKTITTDELRHMEDREGLVLQGCGGDPQEWLSGINELLTSEGILQEGSQFQDAFCFQQEDVTCILFPLDQVQLDMGKLALWRLRTHEEFGGTWLSDYVPNQLGGFLDERPDCPLIGQDGNIFNLVGIASRTLKSAGQKDRATEMTRQVYDSGSYLEALAVISEYVNIVPADEKPAQRAPRHPKERGDAR